MGWDANRPRRGDALAQRVVERNVDFVILLRSFVSHSIQDQIMPACVSADVPMVVVDTGYGVVQVQRAMEPYLPSRLG